MKFKKLILFFIFLASVNAEDKMITHEYPVEAVYYIPGVKEQDEHPKVHFDKDSLKDPFEINLLKRFNSFGITFPNGSSMKVKKKTKTLEMINSGRNHERLAYLVQNYLISNSYILVEATFELYEVDYSDKLLSQNAFTLKPKAIRSSKGAKLLSKMSLKGENNKEIKSSKEGIVLRIQPQINREYLVGAFDVDLTLNKERKPIHLKTSMIAKSGDTQVFQFFDRKSHSKLFYGLLTFRFKDKSGKALTAIKKKLFTAKPGEKGVRHYKMARSFTDWKINSAISSLGFGDDPKNVFLWNPLVSTFILVGEEEKLKKADRILGDYLSMERPIFLSFKLVEVKEHIQSEVLEHGMTWEDMEKVSSEKRKFKQVVCSPIYPGKSLDFEHNLKVTEDKDVDIRNGTQLKVGLHSWNETLSLELKWFHNSSLKDETSAFELDTRYTVYPGRKLVLQMGRDKEVSTYLVLEVINDKSK